jgi:hypothetical protein
MRRDSADLMKRVPRSLVVPCRVGVIAIGRQVECFVGVISNGTRRLVPMTIHFEANEGSRHRPERARQAAEDRGKQLA